MNMELRSTGASFVAAKEHNNPRDLVLETIKKGPSLTRKERFEDFRALLKENDEEFQRAVDWYFYVNMHDYFTSTRNQKADPIERSEARVRRGDTIESIKTQIIMLDLTMPNGKAMRDCTGAEMSKFGNRFQRIAEKVGKGKTVGSVLNEDQVKRILA